MARTTVSDVKVILDNTTLSSSQITAYIGSANVFVTATLGTSGLSSETLAEIERWVAAHMITVTRERLVQRAQAGTALVEYAGKFGGGLASTQYGQMAIQLDTTGTLSSDLEGKKVAWSKAITSFKYD